MVRSPRAIIAVAFLAFGCSGSGAGGQPAPEHVLRATVGTYDDGSGRVGMAALTTIRTEQGSGPDSSWKVRLTRAGDPLGADGAYDAGSSYAVSAWPDVAPAPGSGYDIVASDGVETLSVTTPLADGAPLPLPAPALALDGPRLDWTAVAGAAAYACTASAGATVHLQSVSPTTSCDVAALPDGGYSVSVQALSLDPDLIPSVAAPELPARFDVSLARLGLLRRAGDVSLVLRAAGGRIDYGLVPGLAIWVGLAAADGSPDGPAWDIEVTGPNLPVNDPLTFTLPANFTERLVWAYSLPPDPGLYTVTARSGEELVTTQFAIGAPAPLTLPDGVAVQTPGSGTVRVTWDPVPGAQSYLAAAWLGAAFVAGQWVSGTEALFPAGTFTPGTTYDVYVTATDVDMSGGTPPTRVSASENTYTPTSFVAP